MTKHNKIGFNNFKSFGDKLQTFSHKPLTLVFGPNSIGKSSVLHFLLYIEYIKKSGELDFKQSDFAGDSIDPGGFANFIHKKDVDKSIYYQLTFTKEKDIGKFFSPIYTEAIKFAAAGIFEENIEKSLIRERLSLYKKKNNGSILPLLTFSSTSQKSEWAKKNPFFNKKDKAKFLEKIYFYHDKDSKHLKDQIARSDKLEFDEVDNFILHILDHKEIDIFDDEIVIDKVIDDIAHLLEFYRRINTIYKISIEYKFSIKPKKTYTSRYSIDNELIYTYDSTLKKIETNFDSELMLLFKNSGFLLDERGPEVNMEFNYDLLTNATLSRDLLKSCLCWDSRYFNGGNYLNTLANSINGKVAIELDKIQNIQYLGPLRYFPQRIDLNLTKKTTLNNKCQTNLQEEFLVGYLKLFRFIPSIIRKIVPGGPLAFFSNPTKFLEIVASSTAFRDSLNFFKRNKNKLTSGDSMNSQQIWSAFIKDSTSQQQLNDWLSDETKLKTPYHIRTEKTEKTNIFSKVFGLKPVVTRQLVFVDKRTGTGVTPREMGLGISQVLPILVASMSLENHKIFIEQPELHLHPAVQCELADEFIRSMNTRNNEFILESHSEHLLLRIMKRMRQTAEGTLAKDDELALTPDDVCLLYVDHNGQCTHINELELDTDGSLLDPWPNGFFEEGCKERFA